MSGFRSPVLLESHLLSLAPEVKEIAVPAGTVITPGARDVIRRKNLILKIIPTTN
jgi:ethanolamine utilization cobalamin adenosyltransferase